MDEIRILRIAEVVRLTGLSKPTIHRKVKDGSFPRPIKLGAQSVGWRAADLREWIETRPAAGTVDQPAPALA